MTERVCTPQQNRWLNRFYRNSEAYHERLVMQRSKTWRKQIEHLRVCWGDPPPKCLEIQQSPEKAEVVKLLEPISLKDTKRVWITNGPNTRV